MNEVSVITEALRKEAKKWQALADQLTAAQKAVGREDLGVMAFFIGDASTWRHSAIYDTYQKFMERVLGEGAIEFDQLTNALNKIADEFDDADAVSATEIDQTIDLDLIFQPKNPTK